MIHEIQNLPQALSSCRLSAVQSLHCLVRRDVDRLVVQGELRHMRGHVFLVVCRWSCAHDYISQILGI